MLLLKNNQDKCDSYMFLTVCYPMDNETINQLNSRGDTLLSRYSSSPSVVNERERIMKHTQGKWVVKETHDNLNSFATFISYQVIADDEVTVAKELTQANANLIAAAPEMLEVLKKVKSYFSSEGLSSVDVMRMQNKVDELVAKAEVK